MTTAPAKVFLFTDIEGSTRRWEMHPARMRAALARHDSLMRDAISAQGGQVFKTIGDAFCAVFAKAADAAKAAQRALRREPWDLPEPLRVRMALHAGGAEERDGDFFGPTLNRVARLLCAGHGGQVLLSQAAREALGEDLPAGVSLRDLGERRLKDLIRPERVSQLQAQDLPADFPPLKTLDARPNNLPAQPNALIGRQSELAELQALLRRPDARLVTCTGPGGSGKTRLALQTAAELLDEFEHGVCFVPLASVRESALVAPTTASALGLQERPGEPPAARLKEHLRVRQTLLVLDNFEQVLDAAPLVAELLAAGPRLRVLVTSRALLRLSGERNFPVPPLALPDSRLPPSPASLERCDSTRLFMERARAVDPALAVTAENAGAVADICMRLNGIPLAIELAAARVRLLPPEALRARLVDASGRMALDLLGGTARDLPERQRTLAAVISWSHDLLDVAEQGLFRSLGVFLGGCTLEAVAQVAQGAAERSLLAGLESLIDKSLVRQNEHQGEPRFSMLDTIREFALAQLESRGEAADSRRRHGMHFLGLAESLGGTAGEAQESCFGRLETEHDNLRESLAWALGQGDAETALRMGCALWRFWEVRGHWSEGRRWLEAALALPPAAPGACAPSLSAQASGERRTSAPGLLRAGALHGLGTLAYEQGDLERAIASETEGLEIARRLGDKRAAAAALLGLHWALVYRGEFERGAEVFAESLALSRELGDRRGTAEALAAAAWTSFEHGAPAQAEVLCAESLVLFRELGDKVNVAWLLNVQGEMARSSGDDARAGALYDASMALSREAGDKRFYAVTLVNRGIVALHQGDLARAEAHHREALLLNREMGNKRNIPVSLMGIGGVAAARGDGARAARLLAAAQGSLDKQGIVQAFADRAELDRSVASVRGLLGADAFASAWAAGLTLTLDEAMDCALEAVSPPAAGPVKTSRVEPNG